MQPGGSSLDPRPDSGKCPIRGLEGASSARGADERSEERKGVWGKPLRADPEATDSGKYPIRGLEGACSARGADERSEERKGVWGKPLRVGFRGTDLQASGVHFRGKKAIESDTRDC